MKPTAKELKDWADDTYGLAGGWEHIAEEQDEEEGDDGLGDMYREDAQDARRIAELLEAGEFEKALKEVSELDTSPREAYQWAYEWRTRQRAQKKEPDSPEGDKDPKAHGRIFKVFNPGAHAPAGRKASVRSLRRLKNDLL